MNEQDEKIVRAMEIYGGSFVKALSFAIRCADSQNLARLKLAFPEYWEEYRKMSEAAGRAKCACARCSPRKL